MKTSIEILEALDVVFSMTDRNHRVKRAELCAYLGISDRHLRVAIQKKRASGVRILSDNHSGYWLATTQAEYDDYSRREWRRIATEMETLRRMDANLTGQVIVEEVQA